MFMKKFFYYSCLLILGLIILFIICIEMSRPKISVIMPVYNTKGEYLEASIQSILNQTYKNFEFLIIDDGSTNPETKNILSSYRFKDRRIRLIKGNHNGIAKSLNILISKSRGEYIARMDSDDISMPDRFEKEVRILDKNSNVGLVSSRIKYFGYRNDKLVYPESPSYFDMIRENQIAHPTVMFRRSLGVEYPVEFPYAEDYALWSNLIHKTTIYVIPEELLLYRIHQDMSSNKHMQDQFASANRIKNNMLNFLSKDEDVKHLIMYIIFHPEEAKRINDIYVNKKTRNHISR